MTEEEAIKTIELAKAEVEWNYPMDYAIAFEMAKEALEKQILRKTLIKRTPNTEIQTFCCPTCEKAIISKVENEWLAGRLQNHCDNCGQKLDWSDIK